MTPRDLCSSAEVADDVSTEGTLGHLLGPDVVCCEAPPQQLSAQDSLFEAERQAIAGCAPLRQMQYAASRNLAHRAFRRLGLDPVPLLNHEDRSPRWPQGVVGSLTHTRHWCAVAVAKRESWTGIGIDAESDEPLSPNTLSRVLTPRENAQLREQSAWLGTPVSVLAKLVFSAKESVYKCQYPLTRSFLGFQDVELRFDWASRSFSVLLAKPLKKTSDGRAFDQPLQGHFARRRNLWLSAVRFR